MKPALTALVIALAAPVAAPTLADPSPQLVAQVQSRLARYNIHADVSRLDTMAVAQLHGILNSRDGYLKKRLRIRTVLRNAAAK